VVTLGPTAQATLVANNKVKRILIQVGPIDNKKNPATVLNMKGAARSKVKTHLVFRPISL
jgi:hypothetical protein